MEYGITFSRDGLEEHPSPFRYLTDFARAADQMGCAYGVIGDRPESGVEPLMVFTAVAEASGRMKLVTSVLVLPPRGVLFAAKQFASLDVLAGGRAIAGVGTGSLYGTTTSSAWTAPICGRASRKASGRCGATSRSSTRAAVQRALLRHDWRQPRPAADPEADASDLDRKLGQRRRPAPGGTPRRWRWLSSSRALATRRARAVRRGRHPPEQVP